MPPPATWRQKLVPGCPNCGRGIAPAVHRGCTGALPSNDADLYLDIAAGRIHCVSCGKEWGFERSEHHCNDCGGVYDGGEVWQGMAAEIGQVGNLAWFKGAGMAAGTLDITFKGWSYCLACGQKPGALIRTGLPRGGLCGSCHDLAEKRLGALFSFGRTGKPCFWCKQRGRVASVGRVQICENCAGLIGQQRQWLLAEELQSL